MSDEERPGFVRAGAYWVPIKPLNLLPVDDGWAREQVRVVRHLIAEELRAAAEVVARSPGIKHQAKAVDAINARADEMDGTTRPAHHIDKVDPLDCSTWPGGTYLGRSTPPTARPARRTATHDDERTGR